MGSAKPWTQHGARTLFMRVPNPDWIAVKRGLKSEFRTPTGGYSPMWELDAPMPVVAFRHSKTLGHDSQLMVLLNKWEEPLGAISKESLQREGFEDLASFRTYWCARNAKRFTPGRMIFAYHVRLWDPAADPDFFGQKLLTRLYGEHLP